MIDQQGIVRRVWEGAGAANSYRVLFCRIGSRIKGLRAERGWTQERLAEEAGISRTYMGTVELGAKEATVWTLFRIARALEVDVSGLFQRSTHGNVTRRRRAGRRKEKAATPDRA